LNTYPDAGLPVLRSGRAGEAWARLRAGVSA